MAYMQFCVIFLLHSSVFLINGERLHEQIYSSIEGGAACFRRLNGTHQAGCSSSRKGSVGVVHMVKNISDAEWIVHDSVAGPYMAVVTTKLFNSIVELFMKYPTNVAGLVLYENATDRGNTFTQESRCPNEYSSGPDSSCSSSDAGGFVWNEGGTGLIKRDIPFSIFYLPDSRIKEVEKIEDCYQRFNLDRENQKGRPLCSVQLYAFMHAAVDSRVCLRRSKANALETIKLCDPLGDRNVYYSLFPLNKVKPASKKSIILVTGRIDTSSLFEGLSPGAASSVVGMVTLITAAKVLSEMIPVNSSKLYDYNVLWTLFNGEAFDYIGSQRVAYDLIRGVWPPGNPIQSKDIGLHVELGQIGGALHSNKNTSSWDMFAFVPYTTTVPAEVDEFLLKMEFSANRTNLSLYSNFTSNLPPSSLHSFRNAMKNETESSAIPELLIVDHNKSFLNKYYHSVLDTYDKIDFIYRNISVGSDGKFVSTEELILKGNMTEYDMQVKISNLATVLAQTLYNMVVGESYAGNISASAHLVDEMLYCFLRNQTCRLLQAADYGNSGEQEKVSSSTAPLYVGVAPWNGPSAVFAGHILALLTGVHLTANNTDCNKFGSNYPEFSYYWLKGWNNSGVCVQTTMNFSQALSPAFLIPDYDFTSGLYSTWTESIWTTLWARVFVSATGNGARLAAVVGSITTLITAVLTFWLNKNKHIFFIDPVSTLIVNDGTTGILRTVNC